MYDIMKDSNSPNFKRIEKFIHLSSYVFLQLNS